MNNKVRKVIKSVGNVSLDENKETITIYIDNPYCEDFQFDIRKSNTKQEIKDIINECENYDIDEHFNLWYGANNGEPSSPRALLENCESIGETLDELRLALDII